MLLLLFPAILISKPISPRVVSAAPNLTELILAIGAQDHLVGVTADCKVLKEVRAFTTVGTSGRLFISRIQYLKPDYIFLLVPLQEELVVKLNKLGFKVIAFPGQSIDGLIWTVREMGRLLGKQERANRLADQLESEKRLLEESMPTNRVRVFAEFMYNPPYTVGGDTYLSELIYLAGGINIFSDRNGSLIRVTEEEVIERDPQVILLFHRDASMNIWQRAGWENTEAAKQNRVYIVKDVNLLTLPSHRFKEAVEFLKTCFLGKR